MNDYSFEFCILKYLNVYFLEEEIKNFLLGPLVNLYAPPPLSSGAKRGSPRHWYEHSLLFTCEMYPTQCDLSAELLLDVEYNFL